MNRICLFAVFLLTIRVASAEHYDVYLLAGQSNAGGHGYVSRQFSRFSPMGDDGLVELGETKYLRPRADTIFIHWRGGNPSKDRPVLWDARTAGWIPLAAGYTLYEYSGTAANHLGKPITNHPFGAEVSFAGRIHELRPGRTVAIIKYTQGSTALGTVEQPGAWDPTKGREYDISTSAIPGHCYAGFLQLVQTSLQELSRRGDTYELRGLLWHQGENDSGLPAAIYRRRLVTLMAALRADLRSPDLPVAIGELIRPLYPNIREAQKEAAAEIPNAIFVSSAGLHADSTKIHFDTRAQLELGRRFAERLVAVGK